MSTNNDEAEFLNYRTMSSLPVSDENPRVFDEINYMCTHTSGHDILVSRIHKPNQSDNHWKVHISIDDSKEGNIQQAWAIVVQLATNMRINELKFADENPPRPDPSRQCTIYCDGEDKAIFVSFLQELNKRLQKITPDTRGEPHDCKKVSGSNFLNIRNDYCAELQEGDKPAIKKAPKGYISKYHALFVQFTCGEEAQQDFVKNFQTRNPGLLKITTDTLVSQNLMSASQQSMFLRFAEEVKKKEIDFTRFKNELTKITPASRKNPCMHNLGNNEDVFNLEHLDLSVAPAVNHITYRGLQNIEQQMHSGTISAMGTSCPGEQPPVSDKTICFGYHDGRYDTCALSGPGGNQLPPPASSLSEPNGKQLPDSRSPIPDSSLPTPHDTRGPGIKR